jgi:hypothetical protein
MSRPDLMRQVQESDLETDNLLAIENLDGKEIPVAMRPRLPHTLVLSVGGWVNGAPSLEIQLYDLCADIWAQVKKFLVEKCNFLLTIISKIKVSALENANPDHTMAYHGLARLEDDIYVIGGTENGTDTTRCLRLSLTTLKWEVLPSLTQSRLFFFINF